MKNISDVIVVGGGPCGSFTALKLAKHGADVTVFEEHDEIGVPTHCAGHVSIKGLARLGLYPLPQGIVENTFRGATVYSPSGKAFSVLFPTPVTCVVNRVLFDKHVAAMAENAGAIYRLNSRVESLSIEKGFVEGVNVRLKGTTGKFSAKIVIDAEGVSSKLLKQVRLHRLDHRWLVIGVGAEVENVRNAEPDVVEVFLGNNIAPGFYAWLIPKRDGKARIGLGAKNGNPKKLLQRLMYKHPVASEKLQGARIVRASFHPITLGGPIPKAHSDGFLVVGDAASHVKPTTGGGMVFGLASANLASEVAIEALEANDFSAGFLNTYEKRCEELLGFDVKIMLRLRKMLDTLSDRRLDELIAFCARSDLSKNLRNFGDIDFQGRSLVRLLQNPRILTALGYFFYLYLLPNS